MSFRGSNPYVGNSVLTEDGTVNPLYQSERWAELADLRRRVQELESIVQVLQAKL